MPSQLCAVSTCVNLGVALALCMVVHLLLVTFDLFHAPPTLTLVALVRLLTRLRTQEQLLAGESIQGLMTVRRCFFLVVLTRCQKWCKSDVDKDQKS